MKYRKLNNKHKYFYIPEEVAADLEHYSKLQAYFNQALLYNLKKQE